MCICNLLLQYQHNIIAENPYLSQIVQLYRQKSGLGSLDFSEDQEKQSARGESAISQQYKCVRTSPES
jgi:hypothetical protein